MTDHLDSESFFTWASLPLRVQNGFQVSRDRTFFFCSLSILCEFFGGLFAVSPLFFAFFVLSMWRVYIFGLNKLLLHVVHPL